MRRRGRLFFGWYVVAACFCLALFGWGFGFYGLAFYLAELQKTHGWSTSLISSAATIYYLAGAALVASTGSAMARLGPRVVVLAATAAMATSAAALPFIVAPWQLFAVYLVMAIGWAGMSLAAVTTILAAWFDRRRGLAISLALNGASCGGVVLVPVLVALAGRYGFAASMLSVAAAMLAVLLPLCVLVFKRGPETLGLGRDGDATAAGTHPAPEQRARPSVDLLRSGSFWSVAAPFALALAAQVGFITHQIAFLEPSVGREGAALAVALTTAAAVAGRVGLGFFIDRLDQRRATAGCLAGQAAAILLMTVTHEPVLLYVASAVFGLSVGNLITLPALIVQREFPRESFGAVISLSTATGQLTYAFGPALLGIARDLSGGYGAALGLCIALQVGAAAAILLGRRARRV